MADDRTVILKVELDVDQLDKRAKEAEERLAKLTPRLQDLRKEGKQNTIEYKELQLEIKKYNKQLTDSVKAIQTNREAQENTTGSLAQMREQLAAAKVSFAQLSQEQRESDFGQKAAADMLALKNQINDTEQSFGTFTGSVGNYEKVSSQLTKTLDDVAKGLKPVTAGVEALDEAMEDLRKEGKENTAEFKELEKAYESLDEENKKLAGDMEHLGKDILVEVSGSISKMEDKLYDMALAGDTTSKEFIELQEQTARYKQIVIETDRSVDALAEQGRGLSTALALSETVVAGYQAYTGVTAILGDENEALLATITKLQAAQGILNSIQTIRLKIQENSIKLQQAQTKAQAIYNFLVGKGTILQKAQIAVQAAAAVGMKVLNAVMNANPIFLIITLLTALIAGLAYFFSSTEKAEAANNALNASIDRQNKLFEKNQAQVKKSADNRRRLLAISDASEEEFHNDTLRRLDEEQAARIQEFNMRERNIGKRRKLYKLALEEENFELAKSIREQIEADRKRYGELYLQKEEFDIAVKEENKRYLDDLNKQQEEADKEAEKLREKEEKKRRDAWKKRVADARNAAERIRKLTLENQELTLNNQRAATEAYFDFLESAAEGNSEELLKIEREKNAELQEIEDKQRQAKIDKINSDFEKQKKDAKSNADEVALLEIKQRELVEAVDIDFDARKKKREQEAEQRQDELIANRIMEETKAANEIMLIDKQLALSKAEGTKEEAAAFKALQDEKIRLIKETAAAEIKNSELTAEQKRLINKKAEAEIYEINKEQFDKTDEAAKKSTETRKELALSIVNAAQQFANILLQIAQNTLQEEINKETEKNEQANESLQSQLDAQLITQAEYEVQKQELDNQFELKERELKEKQFKRDKAAAIINATIAAAVGVAQSLPNLVLAGIAGGLGLAQIALIASQPTPKFEKGGALSKEGEFKGNSHSNGGVELSANGVPIAEVEGGEKFIIINKRASGTIRRLSDLNQQYGGVPLAAKGGVMKFQGGGDFAVRASRASDTQSNLTNQMIEVVRSLPPQVVLVQDINQGQENLARVVNNSEF